MVAFKEKIEFDDPISLEEAIRKLKHCYEQSKCISETRHDWKGNGKNKGKWDKKRGILPDTRNKDNAMLHRKFNTIDRG